MLLLLLFFYREIKRESGGGRERKRDTCRITSLMKLPLLQVGMGLRTWALVHDNVCTHYHAPPPYKFKQIFSNDISNNLLQLKMMLLCILRICVLISYTCMCSVLIIFAYFRKCHPKSKVCDDRQLLVVGISKYSGNMSSTLLNLYLHYASKAAMTINSSIYYFH